MRRSRRALCLSALLALCLGGAEAWGETVRLDVEIAGRGKDGPSQEHVRVFISDHRLRIEATTHGEKMRPHVLIYRGDRDVFFSIDPLGKAYIVVDRGLISAFGGQMQAARREVDGQMSRLPDDQREYLERLLGVRETGTPMAQAPLRIVKVRGGDQVGGFRCSKRVVFRGGEKVAELCVVSWNEIGIHEDDLDVFRQLANFQRELMGARELTPLELVPNQPLDVLVQFEGFPLHLKRLRGDDLRSEIRVVSAARLKTDEKLFQVPAGYQRRSAFDVIMGSIGTQAASPAP